MGPRVERSMKTTMIQTGRTELRVTHRTCEGQPVTEATVWSRDRYPHAIVADLVKTLGGRACGNSVVWGREVPAVEIERAARSAA